MVRQCRFLIAVAVLTFVAATGPVGARQLASRPTAEWIARLERPERVAGLKIDYILATPAVAERCIACAIDRNARKGQDASDHAPVIATLDA